MMHSSLTLSSRSVLTLVTIAVTFITHSVAQTLSPAGTVTAGVTTVVVGVSSATTMSTVTAGVTTEIVLLPSGSSTSSSAAASSTSSDGLSNNIPENASSSNSSWISTHWRWILMLAIILVGLVLIAILAVCLKRRHRRKLEEKRAALSGFSAPPGTSRGRTPDPTLGQDMWGPHQHMAYTQGWEYNHEHQDAAVAGGAGVLAADAEKRRSKRAKRDPGGTRKDGSRIDVSEIGSSDTGAVRSASTEPDWYKGKKVAKRSRSRPNTDIIEKM